MCRRKQRPAEWQKFAPATVGKPAEVANAREALWENVLYEAT
jgi:hypothetical protein